MASQTPGAINVEPADLRDLTDFGRQFDLAAPDVEARLVAFAADSMTNVGAAELQRRVASPRQGTARNPPSQAEQALLSFAKAPSLTRALGALTQLRQSPSLRVYRPEVLRSCISTMQYAVQDNCSFHEATERK